MRVVSGASTVAAAELGDIWLGASADDRLGQGMVDEAHVAMQASLFEVESNGKDASPTKKATPKCKLKADKIAGTIELDTVTTLYPAIAWDYKLSNRSALE